jgi:hypothetical protein
MSQIGWINQPRYKWAEWTGKEIKFKPATFYLGVTDHLAKAVEGLTWDNLKNQDFNNDRNQILLNGQNHDYSDGLSDNTKPSPFEITTTIEDDGKKIASLPMTEYIKEETGIEESFESNKRNTNDGYKG